jgi:glycosyltransferase involved in cell wall biosynthesis
MKTLIFVIVLLLNCYGLKGSEHFLSFIIPCYNCEPWIEQAIESIYQQDLQCPFEIICTDDGSKDSTFQILSTLALQHLEMKILQHDKNQGGGATRNTCVLGSCGDIIFCLDSDNVLEKNTVQKLIDHMDKTGADIVCCGSLIYFVDNFTPTGGVNYYTPSGVYKLKDILQNVDSPAWSGNYLYTRKSFDVAGGYPTPWGALDTYAFGFLQLMHGFKIHYVPGTYYWHRHGIESYYIRDARGNKLSINFFKFLHQYKFLFTLLTNILIQRELDHVTRYGHISHDVIWYLANKKLELR